VCFEIDRTDSVYERGWSALAFGVADRITYDHENERLLPHLRPWTGGPKAHWVRIRVEQWSGRRLPRAWRYPLSPP
jgi:hypothetical protein